MKSIRILLSVTEGSPELYADLISVPSRLRAERVRALATIGIAAVSCVPTTAKVAQKSVSAVAPGVIILPHALGANISGVITTAIIAATYVSVLR